MSLIRRCDICGHEFDEHLGVKPPYWIKFSAAKLNCESTAKRYDICPGCINSVEYISDCIDNGEFPINDESCTNLTIVNRFLKKITMGDVT